MEEKNINNEISEEEVAEEVKENESTDEDDAVSEYNDTAVQVAEMEEELSKSKDDYIRLYAEYDNFRKRTVVEKADIYSNATAKFTENLLPVIDSFERALDCECTDENFKNGMNMIFNQFKEFLNKMNIKEIDAMGKEFDPNYHNAIQQLADTDYASNHVCAVYQKGYMAGDKLIRPAMVAVAT